MQGFTVVAYWEDSRQPFVEFVPSDIPRQAAEAMEAEHGEDLKICAVMRGNVETLGDFETGYGNKTNWIVTRVETVTLEATFIAIDAEDAIEQARDNDQEFSEVDSDGGDFTARREGS